MRLREVAATWRDGWSPSGCPDADGHRPVARPVSRSSATTPSGATCCWFHEYFHGDTGAGIGASHQTGWTGLVAHLLCRGGVLDAPNEAA